MLLNYCFYVSIFWILMISSCRSIPQKVGFSDLHNSAISRLFNQKNEAGLEDTTFTVSRLGIRKAGGQLFVFSLGVNRFDMQNPKTVDISEVLQFLHNFRNYTAQNYPNLVFAENKTHLRKILQQGKTAYVFGLEGTYLLENKIHYLDSLYTVGVRKITFGHRFHNQFISKPESRNNSTSIKGFPELLDDYSVISDEGRKLLEKMIEKQMIIGVSHLGKTAFQEILDFNQGRTKIVAGHSNVKKICSSTRNLIDNQIRQIAENKGLIGICLHQPMVWNTKEKADLQKVIRHVRHICNLVGAKFVTFGTDFEGRISPVKGAEKLNANFVQNLVLEMQKQGFSHREIRQILSQNMIHFFLNL